MKKVYRICRDAVQAVINLMDVNITIWRSSAGMSDAMDTMKSQAAEIDRQEAIQEKKIKGYTKEKRDKKFIMATLGLQMSELARAYFITVGDTAQIGAMDFSFTKLFACNSNVAKQLANNIYDTAAAIPVAEQTKFGIDIALPDFRDSIDKYAEVIVAPVYHRAVRTAATKAIRPLVGQIREVLEERVAFLMTNYRISHPDFYNQFMAAKEMIYSHRHTTIEGTVSDLDSGADLKAVKVTISAPGKLFEEMTTVQGKFKKQELNPELDYTVTFELPDYEPFTTTVDDLVLGKHERLSIKLKKIA